MALDEHGLDRSITVERTIDYLLVVQYFIYMEKLSIDDAHRKADAIFKFAETNG